MRFVTITSVVLCLSFSLFAQVAPDLTVVQEPGAIPEPQAPPRDEPRTVAAGRSANGIGQRVETMGITDTPPNVSATLGTSDSTSAFTVFNAANGALLRVAGDGSLSIGTTSLGGKLYIVNQTSGFALQVAHSRTVSASVQEFDYGTFFGTYQNVASGVTNSGSLMATRTRAQLNGEGTLGQTVGDYVESGVYGNSTGIVTQAIGTSIRISAGAGSVGTGYGVYVSDVPATNDYAFYQAGANDTSYFAGNIGIGVTVPAAKLQIADTTAAARILLSGAEYYQPANTSTDGMGLYLGVNRTGNRQLWIGDSGSATAPFFRVTSLNGTTMIDAVSRDGNTPQPLIVGSNGNVLVATGTGVVGIGTSTPTAGYKLDVAGAARVAGNLKVDGEIRGATVIGAVYQDLAEWVPATTDLQPGTVVVLNPGRNNEVMASSVAYDTTVAGVVSAQPGVILGVGGPDKEQIATTGRVKVRVDATRAPIRIGDLLVTSDAAGTAMRSEPMDLNGRKFHQPGTIIGKALEPLASGTGEILVLLSMQ